MVDLGMAERITTFVRKSVLCVSRGSMVCKKCSAVSPFPISATTLPFPLEEKKMHKHKKETHNKQIENSNTCLVKNDNKRQERMLQRGKLSDLGLNSKQSNIRLSFSCCVASPPLGLLSSNSPISPLVLTVGPGINHRASYEGEALITNLKYQ